MAAGDQSKIAEAFVEIRAKLDEFQKDLEDVRVRVEKETQQIGTDAERNIGGGFNRAGEELDDLTEGARKLTGAISSTVGIATSMIGVVTLISTAVLGVVELAERLSDNTELTEEQAEKIYTTYTSIVQSLELAEGKFRNLTDEQQINLELLIRQKQELAEQDRLYREQALTGEQLYELRNRTIELIAKERDARIDAIHAAEQERAQLEARNQAKLRESIDAQNEQLEISMLSGIAKIEAERERAMRATLTKISEEEDALARARLEYRLKLIGEIAQREIDAFRDAEEEKTRIAQEQADKRARNEQAAIARVYQSAVQGQAAISGLSGTIETLADRVEAAIYASGQTSSVRRS